MPYVIHVEEEGSPPGLECLSSCALRRVEDDVVHRSPQCCLEIHLLDRDAGVWKSTSELL